MVKSKNKLSTFNILFKSLMRSMRKNIKQLISIIAISFLSLCLFAGLTSNANNILERQNNLYEKTNLADVYVTTTGLTDDDRTAMRTLYNIDLIEERIYLTANVKNSNVYFVSTEASPKLSHPLIKEGEEGCLMMNSFMKDKELSIGDKVSFTMTNPLKMMISTINSQYSSYIKSLLDQFVLEGGKNIVYDDEITFDMNITGSMYHPEGVQNSSFSNSIVSVTNYSFATCLYNLLKVNYNNNALDLVLRLLNLNASDDSLVNLTSLMKNSTNQILIKTDDPDTAVSSINEYFTGKSNFILAYKSSSLPSYQALNQDVTQAMQLTFVFPIIFFLVSLLIILTTISQMILKSRSEIGVMKAIGVPKKKIYSYFVSFGVVLCSIGGILGFIIGPLLIPNVMGIKYNLLWDMPSMSIHFFYWMSIVMLLALIIVAGLCSFILSYSVIKEKPADTLRTKTNNSDKGLYAKYKSFREKHGFRSVSFGKNLGFVGVILLSIHDFFVFIFRLKNKEIKEKKIKANKKTKVNNFGIVLKMSIRNILSSKGKSLMVILGMMGCTALLVCGFGISDTLNYGVDLDFNVNEYVEMSVKPSGNTDDVYNNLLSLGNVEKVEKVSQAAVSVSYEFSLETTLNILEDNSNYFKVPYYVDGGLTMDQRTAERLNIEIGDTLKIVLSGKIYERKLTYIFESSVLKGVFDKASGYPNTTFSPTTFYLTLKDLSKSEETKEEIMKLDDVSSCSTAKDIKDRADSLLSTINIMTDVVKIFAILLCVVVIYNLTSLNIAQRKRDIATMKVLGFHFKEISMTLAYELAIDSLIGSLIGLALGFPLAVLVLSVNKTDLLTFLYHINWTTYIISFVIAFITSIVVSLLLNFKTKKIPMAESLKSIE